MLASSPALYLLYASGRRNVLSLHATLKLFPLHDVLMAVWNTAWAIIEPTTDSSESLEFDVTLGSGSAGLQDGVGVWGVIDKGLMHSIRKTRYDMTFPRMHESATMPITHALYAEHSDTTDALLKTPNVGITDLLAQPAATKILKFFIVTDQPARKPLRGALPADRRTRRVCVGLHKPSSTDDAAAAQAWLQVALNVADLLSRPVLKPDVSRKLAKTRAEVDAALDAEYKKEQDEDAGVKPVTAEDKAADKKAARKRGMSEKELKKQEELERKREMRKMQKRNAK